MGCASSKHLESSVDVYRPAPSSFAVFDIHAIEEPWLNLEQPPPENHEKPPTNIIPTTILEKLEAAADAPRSWDEVSKTLQIHLKPAGKNPPPATPEAHPDKVRPLAPKTPTPPRKSFSFHTVEEIEAKTQIPSSNNDKNQTPVQLRKTESTRTGSSTSISTGFRSVKENIFVVRDRLERQKEGKKKPAVSWDPLSEFPEKCPPGGTDTVVFYTTSLRGIRSTYEDCIRARSVLEQQGVVFDERDVSLHSGYLSELRELVGTEGDGGAAAAVAPPRVFIKGRYVGGAEQLVALNESGRLGRIMRWARVERVGEEGRHTCEVCGGVRWLPCLECGGSCKVVAEDGGGWERCGKCNENGLVRCPTCVKV